jgi:16S rRNA processing protein RimM
MFVKIGKTQKPHSIKGELKLNVEEKFVDDLFDQEAVFIQIKGQYVPYFIESLREGNTIILKLEDIENRSAAEALAHKDLFLRRDDLSLTDEEIESKGLLYGFLEGYMLIDEELGEIAVIEEVAEFPQQEMAYITYQDKVCLIPLNTNLIKEIQKEEKKVLVDLPEGLLDVFLD